MNKRLTKNFVFSLFVAIMFFLPMQIVAQTVSGDFSGLKKQAFANIKVNYTDASIHGLSEEDFSYIEPDWEKEKPTVLLKIISQLSDRLQGKLTFGLKRENSYTIVINVVSVNSKGTHLSNVDIISPSGEVEASIQGVEGKGGTFGSAINLIGDGAKSTGKNIAKILSNKFSKIK